MMGCVVFINIILYNYMIHLADDLQNKLFVIVDSCVINYLYFFSFLKFDFTSEVEM